MVKKTVKQPEQQRKQQHNRTAQQKHQLNSVIVVLAVFRFTDSSKTIRFKNNSFYSKNSKNSKTKIQKYQKFKNPPPQKKKQKKTKIPDFQNFQKNQNELFSSCLYIMFLF